MELNAALWVKGGAAWTDRLLTIWLYLWLVLFIIPASTSFCGAVFGSWRGALVAAVSTGGGLLLTQLLTSVFSGLQAFSSGYALDRQPPYLLLGPLAALVVGLLYECRHDEDGGKASPSWRWACPSNSSDWGLLRSHLPLDVCSCS